MTAQPTQRASSSTAVTRLVAGNDNDRSWRAKFRPEEIEYLVAASDVFLIVAIAALSGILSNTITNTVGNAGGLVGVGALSAVNFVCLNIARGGYRLKSLAAVRDRIRDAVGVWIIVCCLMLVVGFAMKIGEHYSRGAATIFFFGGLFGLGISRFLVSQFVTHCLATGAFSTRKIVVLAEESRAIRSLELQELQRYGYEPLKIIYLSHAELSSMGASSSLRQKLLSAISIARTERVEAVFVMISWRHERFIDLILDALKVLPLPVHLVPDDVARRFLNKPRTEIGSLWTAEVKRAPLSEIELFAKRLFDMTCALVALLMLSPLLLLSALLIRLDSRGPILFRQKRNGFNGRAFEILKFRTMYVQQGEETIVRQAVRGDPRVTRIGRWLRQTSIDELPQLWNVLRGDMSIVGPRPHACSHNTQYEALISSYAFRNHMKPGLTGWAQVRGYRGETPTLDLMKKRVEHDLWYINNWSLSLDLRISLRTMIVALGQSRAY